MSAAPYLASLERTANMLNQNLIVLPNTMNEKAAWLDRFGLNWRVETRPLYTVDGKGQALKLDEKAVVRVDNDTVLNTVTNRYAPIQNEVYHDMLAEIERQGFIKNLRGGSFSQGGKTYIQAEFGDSKSVGQNDEIRARLLLATSHDGSFSFRSTLSPIRIACMNTLMAAISDQSTKISIRHTAASVDRLNDMKIMLQSLSHSFDKTMEFYKAFAGKQLNSAEVQKFLRAVLAIEGKADEDLTDTETARMTKLIQLFENGQGQNLNRGTLWSAFNAVTEFTSHYLDKDAGKREEKLLFGQGADLNTAAFKAALKLVA